MKPQILQAAKTNYGSPLWIGLRKPTTPESWEKIELKSSSPFEYTMDEHESDITNTTMEEKKKMDTHSDIIDKGVRNIM